jgi:hypothetical protein
MAILGTRAAKSETSRREVTTQESRLGLVVEEEGEGEEEEEEEEGARVEYLLLLEGFL